MYFSLIEPAEGAERDAAFDRLHGPYAEHQWLWTFFPAPEGTPRDFLFRRMDGDTGSRFYVVSARGPKATSRVWDIRTRPYAPQLHTGQRLRFDVRVNPVVASMRDGKSRRDDVVMHEKKRLVQEKNLGRWADWKGAEKPAEYDLVQSVCTRWLCGALEGRTSRAELAGFSVVDGTLAADAYTQHEGGMKSVRFSTVSLSGELEVLDPERLVSTLHRGLGRGKAFGCGLLMVRPV